MNGDLRLFHLTLCFKQTVQTLSAGLIWVCTVCQCPSPGFTDNPSAAINNRYLAFVQMRGLISLVNDYHVDNNAKKILVYIDYGSIVNNRRNKSS